MKDQHESGPFGSNRSHLQEYSLLAFMLHFFAYSILWSKNSIFDTIWLQLEVFVVQAALFLFASERINNSKGIKKLSIILSSVGMAAMVVNFPYMSAYFDISNDIVRSLFAYSGVFLFFSGSILGLIHDYRLR